MTEAVMGEEAKPTGEVYLVRHGETSLNKEGKLRGWENPPLNAEGKQNAEDIAHILSGVELDVMYVSDFKRAQQTADAIGESQDAKRIDTPNLRPINFGKWNGKPLTEVDKKMEDLAGVWKSNPSQQAPGGESWSDFQRRQILVWDSVMKDAKDGKKVIIVAHLRNCIWGQAYVLNGCMPLSGDSLDLCNYVTQQIGRVSLIDVGKDKCQIIAVNCKDVEDPGMQPNPKS